MIAVSSSVNAASSEALSLHSATFDAWIGRARSVPIEAEIKHRGIKLRGAGVERVGPCPRCGGDDRFSINVSKQVFNCRGCGGRGDVIDLVMFLDSCDFVRAGTALAGEPPPKAKSNGNGKASFEPKKVAAGRYDYETADGSLAFRVVRVEYQNPDDGSFVEVEDEIGRRKRKKTFRQCRPDPERLGKWIWNVDGVPVVPYRLPELIEAIGTGHFVVIAEGEAKVDLLRSWNVPATCNAQGAKKWRTEHAKFLRGADVVILPDNDEPGREHGEVVAASLQGLAASIRVLELPDLPPKGDVIDWATNGGTVEQLHDLIAREAKSWTPKYVGADEKIKKLDDADLKAPDGSEGIAIDDFHAYLPMHNYIFAPSREPWPASSVNSKLGPVPLTDTDGNPLLDDKGKQQTVSASKWLDQNKPIAQMTWAPGLPLLVRDRLIAHGGWIDRPKVTCLNLYLPPTIVPGNATEADLWLDHVHKIYPDDANHIINWLAHRVQRPAEKINHALVLGGKQGIGKDTLLEPVKRAVGPWNFIEVSPSHMLGRFNGFLKSVILRINEARDLGDINRYQFYDHLKAYTAAPPDVLRVDEKNLREYSVINCCGVIITSNHKTDGIYLPADDRRHYVAWSELTKDDFVDDYWNTLWGWYASGGHCHVSAYLAELDISVFDAKAPPPKTPAFWSIVDASRAPEDAELADVLDRLGNPDATTIARVTAAAMGSSFGDWIKDRKNRRTIPHRFEQCGYVPVRNDARQTGLWVIDGSRQVIYAKAELSIRDQHRAATELTQRN